MARRSNNSGFTLLELVLVMLILAIGAAVAAPTLGGFTKGRRLPNTAQDIVTAAHWCRIQAISDGLNYRLNFDARENKWWITKDDGTTGTNFVPATTQMINIESTLPEGIAMETDIKPSATDGLTFISFDAGGRSDVATIHLSAGDGNSIDILTETPFGSYHIAAKPEGQK